MENKKIYITYIDYETGEAVEQIVSDKNLQSWTFSDKAIFIKFNRMSFTLPFSYLTYPNKEALIFLMKSIFLKELVMKR
jgi:hypothetical protein